MAETTHDRNKSSQVEFAPQKSTESKLFDARPAKNSLEARPKLSVVVVCYEMAAQIENTLRSLLPPYQRGVETTDYEIILIDNGSAKVLDEETRTVSPNLQLYLSPA
jgi:vacuolar-type H+-ATPase subunit F/Vma7